jgi:putative ABC transport system permease protein
MSSALSDLRYAWRGLAHAPAAAIVAIASIGFGVGASTAIFSVVDRVLLASLPYPEPERVITLTDRTADGEPIDVTYGTYVELAQRNRSFEALAVADRWQPSLASEGQPQRLEGDLVSADYFRVLGVEPALGRNFEAADDVGGAPPVVIIDARLAARQFGSVVAALDRRVSLDGQTYTVIGVLPDTFENALSPAVEVWAPRRYRADAPFESSEWGHHLRMVGRLRADSSLEEARRDVDAIARNPVAELARPDWASLGRGLALQSLQASATREVRPALLATFGAVLLLLAIACANVTNILLARSLARRSELAIRAAVGAEHHQIVRQLFAESALVAVLGGALGIGVAALAGRALLALAPAGLPRLESIGFDARVLSFAMAATAVVALVVGLVPAMRARELGSHIGLTTGARALSPGLRVLRQSLVVAQVALATVLLACAGLLLRSVGQLLDVPTGFDGSRTVAMQVVASGAGIRSNEEGQALFERVLDAVRAVPGVDDAALTSQLPLSGDNEVYGVVFESATGGASSQQGGAGAFGYTVTPGWFETMGIPLKRGRLLGAEDRGDAPQAVLINESFAARRFAGRDPIGQPVRLGPYLSRPDLPPATVVGVVGDVKQVSLASPSPDAFYVAMGQWPWVDSVQSLVVRTARDPTALVQPIKEAVWSVNPTLPLERVTTMSDLVARSEAQRTFALTIFTAFGLAALLLAGIGVYGVIEGRVTERTREIGLRAALGATPARLAALVVGNGLVLTVLGVAVGVGAAIGATRAITSLLFGIEPFDLVTYGGVAALLLSVAFVACYAPAFRAARIAPTEALRHD